MARLYPRTVHLITVDGVRFTFDGRLKFYNAEAPGWGSLSVPEWRVTEARRKLRARLAKQKKAKSTKK